MNGDLAIPALVASLFALPLAAAIVRRRRPVRASPAADPAPPIRRDVALTRPCTVCGAKASALDTACPACGALLPSRRLLCPRCGLMAGTMGRFCKRCRTPLA